MDSLDQTLRAIGVQLSARNVASARHLLQSAIDEACHEMSQRAALYHGKWQKLKDNKETGRKVK